MSRTKAGERSKAAEAKAVAKLKYKGVLIVTYGRSGSTLLQGLLNAIPGCLVRGENHNLCYGLFSAYQSILRSRAEPTPDGGATPTSPWFGASALDPERFLADAAAIVRRQLLADVDPATVACLGFKEIRYPGLADLPQYLNFLETVFPDTAFVFLTRDLASVGKSAWWRDTKPEDVQRNLGRFEQTVRAWAGNRKNFFNIDYSDLAGHGPRIAELFTFLGASYDRASVEAVLATPHSYTPPAESRKKQVVAKAPVSPSPSPAAGDGRATPWLRVQAINKAHTRVFFFDPLPDRPAAGKTVAIGGSVLPQETLPDGLRMVLRTGAQKKEVQWQLPSPGVGGRFPNDAKAARARFRLQVPADLAASELVLEAADGQSWVIARLNADA